MEYSSHERKMDLIFLLINTISTGMYFSIQILLPMIRTNSIASFLQLYFTVFIILLLVDLLISIRILFISIDYEKHRWVRVNIGILSLLLFIQLIIIFPKIFDSDLVEIQKRLLIITTIYIVKLLPIVKIFTLFQESHKVLIGKL